MCGVHVVHTRQKYDFLLFNLYVFELDFESLLLNTYIAQDCNSKVSKDLCGTLILLLKVSVLRQIFIC